MLGYMQNKSLAQQFFFILARDSVLKFVEHFYLTLHININLIFSVLFFMPDTK